MLGKEIIGVKLDTNHTTVVVEDKGRTNHWFVIEKSTGKRLFGTINDNQFTEVERSDFNINQQTVEFQIQEKQTNKSELQTQDCSVYVVEYICGGNNATGGGCGAALAVTETNEETFNSINSQVYCDFQEHTDSEIGERYLSFRNKGILNIKLVFKTCRECRRIN
jgi:hypothetical protein